MEYLNVDDDLYPTTFFHRVSTWVVIGVAVLLLLVVGARIHAIYTTKKIDGQIQRAQYDSAWANLRSVHLIGDCRRFSLTSDLLMRDEREDSLLLRVADSFRACNPEPDRLYQLVARGNMRLARRGTALDSASLRGLYSAAWKAAMSCVHADSANRDCAIDGYLALGGMKNPAGQLEWAAAALSAFPKDTLFLAFQAQATIADSLRRAAGAADTAAGAADSAATTGSTRNDGK